MPLTREKRCRAIGERTCSRTANRDWDDCVRIPMPEMNGIPDFAEGEIRRGEERNGVTTHATATLAKRLANIPHRNIADEGIINHRPVGRRECGERKPHRERAIPGRNPRGRVEPGGEEPRDAQAKPASYLDQGCLLYTSPSPRDRTRSRMPSSA